MIVGNLISRIKQLVFYKWRTVRCWKTMNKMLANRNHACRSPSHAGNHFQTAFLSCKSESCVLKEMMGYCEVRPDQQSGAARLQVNVFILCLTALKVTTDRAELPHQQLTVFSMWEERRREQACIVMWITAVRLCLFWSFWALWKGFDCSILKLEDSRDWPVFHIRTDWQI